MFARLFDDGDYEIVEQHELHGSKYYASHSNAPRSERRFSEGESSKRCMESGKKETKQENDTKIF